MWQSEILHNENIRNKKVTDFNALVRKYYQNKTTIGCSFASIAIDGLSYLLATGYSYHYSYPFSTYGDNLWLAFGSFYILFQIWFYNGAHVEKDGLSFYMLSFT